MKSQAVSSSTSTYSQGKGSPMPNLNVYVRVYNDPRVEAERLVRTRSTSLQQEACSFIWAQVRGEVQDANDF